MFNVELYFITLREARKLNTLFTLYVSVYFNFEVLKVFIKCLNCVRIYLYVGIFGVFTGALNTKEGGSVAIRQFSPSPVVQTLGIGDVVNAGGCKPALSPI
jgi:hypothetical protein